jgi:hypothetical protein
MYESTAGCDCGCGSGSACTCIAGGEFIRVRYYFGQRLGVMELNDQFLYHAGKMAFHNARLHGAGVLCGLQVARQPGVALGSASTVLRVSSGSAVDACGREIVVGVDQCIDVAAWFARNKGRPALAGWTANSTQTLRVAIRFRECPSDPSPAPRDPCGCDNGGCEFGRVREAFELGLFDASESICDVESFPSREALQGWLASAGDAGAEGGTEAPERGLHALLAAACPRPSSDRWLCLASVAVQLDAAPVPVDLQEPDNAIPERRSLLTVRALQDLVLGLVSDGAAAGLIGAGPRAGVVTFDASTVDPAKAGTLHVPIALVLTGNPPAAVPLIDASFDKTALTVSRLDAGGWTDITPAGVSLDTTTNPPRIDIAFTQDLAAGQPFAFAYQPAPSHPTLDADGGVLHPFSRRVQFLLDGSGALTLDPTA